MVNVNKLKGKIVERGMSVEDLANSTGINKATIYRKLRGDGCAFSIEEADKIAKSLSLSGSEASSIFFSQYVAFTQQT